MQSLPLKYGCNPNQLPASISMDQGELPLEVLCGKPGYINFLDALNSWQLVKSSSRPRGCPRRPPSSMSVPPARRWPCR